MKSLVILAVCVLAVGCVTVSAPTNSPTLAPTASPSQAPATASPSPSAAPSPTASPSPAPTDTLAPTESPTVAPSASPAPTASAEPTGELGFDDRDVVFSDDLSDPTGECVDATVALPDCWGIGVTGGGAIAYVDGALQFDTASDTSWMWSRRELGSTNTTMRIAAEFMPSSEGSFGILCGSGDELLFGVLVGTDGSWSFVKVAGDAAEELQSDESAGLSVPIGASSPLALECAGTASGMLRMQLWLENTGLVAIYEADEGPENFDRAAVYVDAASDSFSVQVDNLIAFGSGFADNQVTQEAAQLLTHVPSDWQDQCYQGLRPPLFGGTAEAVVTCFLAEPGHDGAEVAEFAQFLTTDAMDEAYQKRVDAFGTGDGVESCAVGSSEHAYRIGEVESGRLLCVPQFSGIRFDWTDSRLNILSMLVDLDGDFGLTFADWQAGGPNP